MLKPTIRHALIGVEVAVVLLAAAFLVVDPGAPLPAGAGQDPLLIAALAEVNTDTLMSAVTALASERTRRYGSEGAAASVSFITTRLRAMGYGVEHQRVHVEDGNGDDTIVTNVICDLGVGSGTPQLLLCAHYDSRGEDGIEIAPGADDNASGVAVLLEAARVLRLHKADANVRLVFFGGEEDDFLGSRAYVDDAEALPAGVINVDMVGYDAYGPMDLVIFANEASKDLVGLLMQVASHSRLRIDVRTSEDGNSDHISFWAKGVPAVSIWEGYDHNPQYHTPRDIPARLTPEFLTEVGRLVTAIAFELGAAGHPQHGPSVEDRLSGIR